MSRLVPGAAHGAPQCGPRPATPTDALERQSRAARQCMEQLTEMGQIQQNFGDWAVIATFDVVKPQVGPPARVGAQVREVRWPRQGQAPARYKGRLPPCSHPRGTRPSGDLPHLGTYPT